MKFNVILQDRGCQPGGGVDFTTFYEQLLCAEIPKEQKDTNDLIVFLHFWDLCA